MAAELDAAARDRALEALAAGHSKAEAARRSGYSRMHIHRLLEDETFKAALEKRAAEVDAEEGTGRADAREAIAFLRKVVAGEVLGEAPAIAVRVTAARALLAHASRGKKVAKTPAAIAPITRLPSPAEDEAAAAEWSKKNG